MRASFHVVVFLLLLAAGAVPAAQAQSAPPAQPAQTVRDTAGTLKDGRWTAWLGCWQQLEETVRSENLVAPDSDDAVPTPGVVVCVTPLADGSGVTLNTIVEKQVAFAQTMVADGTSRAIDEPGCRGTQTARWSQNGRRLFASAELTCSDGTTRTVSGVTTIAPGPVWVDIQVVNAKGQESIRVRRYRRSADRSHIAAELSRERLAASAAAAAQQARAFNLEEVKEASGQLAPSALEAALIETNAKFPLNAARLEELDAAGVPDRVLDLMIALSFPQKFVVERRTAASSSLAEDYSTGWFEGPGFGLLYPGYDIFPYGYAPFAYGMWGRRDYYYYGAPAYYYYGAAINEGGGGSSGELRPSGDGRVVDGLGYTRVRARDPQPANHDGLVAGVSTSGDAGSSSGSSTGSSGGVSSQGYSGGGGGDSGRTAVARPPD